MVKFWDLLPQKAVDLMVSVGSKSFKLMTDNPKKLESLYISEGMLLFIDM